MTDVLQGFLHFGSLDAHLPAIPIAATEGQQLFVVFGLLQAAAGARTDGSIQSHLAQHVVFDEPGGPLGDESLQGIQSGGDVFLGANVENASYGLALCAERTAIFSAVAAGQRRFEKLAVVCACDGGCLPCGACRQVIAEFAPHLPLILGTPDGQFETTTLDALLPRPFLPEHVA